jgi:enoyl-CoA hydratase
VVNSLPRLDAGRLLSEALGSSGDAPRSALSGNPWLLVDLEPHALPHAGERAALARWLRHQSCPVIGIAERGVEHPFAFACDTVVVDAAQAAQLVTNIEATPLAAMVLVQLLRATEGLEVERALIIESFAYATLQGGAEFRRWLAHATRPTADPGTESGPPVLVTRMDAQLHLRLNRPARRNALSVPMRDALVEALELVLCDTSITHVSLRGEGPCFSAGGELAEFGSVPDAATAHAVRSTRSVAALLARCAPQLTAHVHGAAVGAGAEMAAFAARVEASTDAFFQLPELRYGLIPGCGGCVSIPRRIGRLRTAYLALSGQRLDARSACSWGLVDAVTPSLPATPARAPLGAALRRFH